MEERVAKGFSHSMELNEKEQLKHIENHKNLICYLDSFLKINVDEINKKMTDEARFTLKQFLYESYLSASEISKIIKGTDFKASAHHVKERLENFVELNLIKKIKGDPLLKSSYSSTFYELTGIGLFYLLKEVTERDVREYTKEKRQVIIFKTYKDNPLFQIMMGDLLDIKLLSSLTDNILIWEITKYLRQVCIKIEKELKNFYEFYRTGKIEKESMKWKYDLKNDRSRWNDFCYEVLENVFHMHYLDSKSSDFIADPNVTLDYLSFVWDSIKYSIRIDKDNEIAKLMRDDVEYEEIRIKKNRTCFVLYSPKYISGLEVDFLDALLWEICIPVENMKIELGHSILRLYGSDTPYSMFQNNPDLIKLTKDEKFIAFIDEINNEFKKCYFGFKASRRRN